MFTQKFNLGPHSGKRPSPLDDERFELIVLSFSAHLIGLGGRPPDATFWPDARFAARPRVLRSEMPLQPLGCS